MTIEEIKQWVVKKSSVTNPYKRYWSASVTLGGMDINGTGETIERAYCDLTYYIFNNVYYFKALITLLAKAKQAK